MTEVSGGVPVQASSNDGIAMQGMQAVQIAATNGQSQQATVVQFNGQVYFFLHFKIPLPLYIINVYCNKTTSIMIPPKNIFICMMHCNGLVEPLSTSYGTRGNQFITQYKTLFSACVFIGLQQKCIFLDLLDESSNVRETIVML